MGKVKIKIGMANIYSTPSNKKCVRSFRVVEEYDEQYLVDWGKCVSGDNLYPNDNLVSKSKAFNVVEKEISKFKLWCYKHLDMSPPIK